MRRPRRSLLLASALSVVVVVAAGVRWLALEDALEPCPAIVVLNGDHPARVDEAARIRRAGHARAVWLTNDPRSGGPHTPDAGTDSNVRRLVDLGTPTTAIEVLPDAAIGTRAELSAIVTELERRGWPCVIVVTSAPHGPRVKITWWRLTGGTPRLVVRHAPDAAYAGWRAAVSEVGLAALAMLGLPR